MFCPHFPINVCLIYMSACATEKNGIPHLCLSETYYSINLPINGGIFQLNSSSNC